MDMRECVRNHPILAIMRNVPLEQTVDYAGAVLKGGVSFFEVALNSEHALKQISMLRDAYGDKIILGAGTAITVDLAKSALDAGAKFLLAPSADEDVLAYCAEHEVAMLPGVLTPSDVSLCLRYGFTTMKMFPAGSMPLSYIKALKGPFDDTEYVAIGGVNPDNISSFFEAGYLGAGLGSNLCPKTLTTTGRWDECSAHIASLLKKIGR
jgi:2-dehydro-3-deoxyphosphogluconate aldolase/(4S)-4-hydroxy-2-oxoglutarate aldolase